MMSLGPGRDHSTSSETKFKSEGMSPRSNAAYASLTVCTFSCSAIAETPFLCVKELCAAGEKLFAAVRPFGNNYESSAANGFMTTLPKPSTDADAPTGTSVVEEYSVTTHGARKAASAVKSSRR